MDDQTRDGANVTSRRFSSTGSTTDSVEGVLPTQPCVRDEAIDSRLNHSTIYSRSAHGKEGRRTSNDYYGKTPRRKKRAVVHSIL